MTQKEELKLAEEPKKPELSFKKGDILKHASGGGPDILYIGDGVGEVFTDQGHLGRLEIDEERFHKI